MESTTTVPTLEELLAASAATPEFRAELLAFRDSQRAGTRIAFGRGNPPVKVLRALCGLLDAAPDLAIDRAEVSGASGCSDYRGTITVNGGEATFRFVWDCAWKAEQAGLKDFMGYPDQAKAARTYGWQCFQVFEREG